MTIQNTDLSTPSAARVRGPGVSWCAGLEAHDSPRWSWRAGHWGRESGWRWRCPESIPTQRLHQPARPATCARLAGRGRVLRHELRSHASRSFGSYSEAPGPRISWQCATINWIWAWNFVARCHEIVGPLLLLLRPTRRAAAVTTPDADVEAARRREDRWRRPSGSQAPAWPPWRGGRPPQTPQSHGPRCRPAHRARRVGVGECQRPAREARSQSAVNGARQNGEGEDHSSRSSALGGLSQVNDTVTFAAGLIRRVAIHRFPDGVVCTPSGISCIVLLSTRPQPQHALREPQAADERVWRAQPDRQQAPRRLDCYALLVGRRKVPREASSGPSHPGQRGGQRFSCECSV